MTNIEAAEPVTDTPLPDIAAKAQRPDIRAYRPDIDGLRALAILSVVSFHVGIRALHGGFVGVDIFFVVSGYLIGGIVYDEAKSGTFTFARFYERRAKRILRAFFGVLLFCYAVAMLILSPDELRRFAETALSAIFSVSNVHLWLTTGYFTNGAQFNPLLMTWSLAVEEQFYILFPVALLVVLSFRRHLVIPAVAIFSILSFGLSVWGVAHHRTKWHSFCCRLELGRLERALCWRCALKNGPASIVAKSKLAVHLLGGLGAVLLICSILLCRSTQFPGVAALLPVGGTLLLIGTRKSFVSSGLSARPVVFVGKLSYSWYLWHWPMLSFARIASDRPLRLGVTLSIAALSFLAALASFYLIEQPFRQSAKPARRMLIQYATALVLVSVPAIALWMARGCRNAGRDLPKWKHKVRELQTTAA